MSQTVIDFGAVDWGKIWGDRASLVTTAHLNELNSISAQTHLSSPGYWRNLFSSYSEVKEDASRIARLYTRPGQQVKTFETHTTAPILSPGQANKFNEDKRAEAITQRDAMLLESDNFSKNPFNVAGAIIGQRVKDTEVYQKGSQIAEKALNVGEKVGQAAENLLDITKNVTKLLADETQGGGQSKYVLYAFGLAITSAYVISSLK